MIDFNKFFSTIYRLLAVKFLIVIFIIAIGYAFLVSFFVVSDTWAVPIVLSPAQSRVLSFQPQIAALQTNLNKQRIELATAQATVIALGAQIEQVGSLIGRVGKSIASEANQLSSTGNALSSLAEKKKSDIKATEISVSDARSLMSKVDEELAAKLITSDQAAQRRISLQGALNSSTDAKAASIQLDRTMDQMKQAANTLRGGSTSLIGITSIKQAQELRALMAQLGIQYTTAEKTVLLLTESIKEQERVLVVAKTSPYYRALTNSITVGFVPYENMDSVKTGMDVYDCYLKVFLCSKVGEVGSIYEAEEYASHPLFKTDLRGQFIEVRLSDPESARSQVFFIGSKPLFF
jgi:hypothetical protein